VNLLSAYRIHLLVILMRSRSIKVFFLIFIHILNGFSIINEILSRFIYFWKEKNRILYFLERKIEILDIVTAQFCLLCLFEPLLEILEASLIFHVTFQTPKILWNTSELLIGD